ncbi:MAG: DNA polymerase I [Thermodesulfovibrio sp.]|uniref:DNA polymerase I n=1 Tax=unclassified Thermodesulfovibrio TaxID=2645936 RepID=UPI00083AFAC1|nr:MULTISPECIES: DNA polymerase I [unclassified Thermodesulfovibrio]MDI1472201.1 DNA polymerase I [Thermodesulfovibrio sp. 1176]MDI6714064.1 DNA polymerase I [Thermodesulfovibrio sp.]ODA43861.1 DNA polymerase I [Thermodesulfovibrio sp. N1]
MNEVYLLDGSCFVYRAYHAIRTLSTSKGLPTNAIYGFTRMLLKLLKERKVQYMLIAFDSPYPTKRHKVYEEYKITRPETPKDLLLQLNYIKEIVDAFGIKRVEIPGYEADDIIASAVFNINNAIFYIVTLDKDMLQIISENIKIYDPFNNLVIDRDFVIEKYGISPEKLSDFMALVGDSIDNIPGVKGIGEKSALELIKRYGSVENILKNIEIVKPSRIAELIRKNTETLKLSKELVLLKTDVPIDFNLEELKIKEPDTELLIKFFSELEFHSLLKEIFKQENYSHSGLQLSEKKMELSDITNIEESDKFAVILKNSKIHIFTGKSFYEFEIEETSKILSSPSLKIVYNTKELLKTLQIKGIILVPPYFDLMIVSYLINPNKGKYGFSDIAFEYLGKLYYEKTEAELMFELYEKLNHLLKERSLEKLYYEIEMPLIEVLAHMEEAGIKIDIEKLERLTKELSLEIDKIKDKIYKIAGNEFNINSPKQLAEILYDKLGLKSRKRGKKARSTEMEVLQELAFQHELPQEVINYRILNKLLTGYLQPLKAYINPETSRIHAKWLQTIAGTGRLTCSEPNLQNIPVKGQWAEFLREVFVPERGFLFLSADYSQIELRILAHLSNDPSLIKAFNDGKDIHRATASEIFSVQEEEITDEQRRIAKTVNFGISYGISAFGLSESIKIPYEKAQELIDLYFLKYPFVRKFIEETIDFAKVHGYVKTLFGRVRPVPDINSPNQFLRMQAERIAVNTVVQGTAADLIKIAMIRIYDKIIKGKFNAKLVLQVHDEIVLEVIEEQIDEIEEIVRNEMVNFSLSVPLEVNIYKGKSLNL